MFRHIYKLYNTYYNNIKVKIYSTYHKYKKWN